MPGTKNLMSALREQDIAAVVSGAGPSVLALVPDEQDLLSRAHSLCPAGWYATSVPIAAQGALLFHP